MKTSFSKARQSSQNWLFRTSRAVGQGIGGFLDVEILGWDFKSLRWFKFLPGDTGRTRKPLWRQQRRTRHATGNFSIHLLLLLLGLLSGGRAMAEMLNAHHPQAQAVVMEQLGDDFEAMMLQLLFNQLQQGGTLENDDPENPFRPSSAEKIFRGMRDEAVIKKVAGGRPLGFGDTVVRHLKGQGGVEYHSETQGNRVNSQIEKLRD